MKVVVIGLDGATWTLLHPLAKSGKMPSLKKLMKEGSFGTLRSTIPPVSAPAWTSITTGMNPGKHGVFDFMRIGDNFSKTLCHSRSKMAAEIWDYLNRSVVANVPLTYPPRRIRGSMITGMGTPSTKSEFTYPRSLKNEILNEIPGYSIELDWQDYRERKDEFFQDIQEVTENKIRLFWHLFSFEWDLLFFVLTETDRIQHILWGTNQLIEYYTLIDRFLKDVTREIFGDDMILILLSDHGFQSCGKMICVNSVLEKLGCIEIRNSPSRKWLEARGITSVRLDEMLRRVGLAQMYINLPPAIQRKLRTLVPGKRNPEYDFNMDKTKAAMVGTGGIYLNRKGDSVVRDTTEDNLIENLVSGLKRERDPETGATVFEGVYRKSELYHGPFTRFGPDLVVIPSKNYCLSSRMEIKPIGISDFKKGDHSPEGILLICGKDVKRDFEMKSKCIYDIAPTILHMLGVPVPDNMDGRVLIDIFEESSKLCGPISYRKKSEKEKVMEKVRVMRTLGRV